MLSARSLFRKSDGARQRAKRLAERWARRRQGTDGEQITLTSRRVYILPTAIGFIYGIALFLMLLAAMNYSNSLAFILTFFLAACALVAMHVTHANLNGLELIAGATDRAFAGDPLRHHWQLSGASARSRLDIEVGAGDARNVAYDIEPGHAVTVALSTPTSRRGLMQSPRFGIRTVYPLGLFRAWAWIHPAQDILVWPKLVADPPPLPAAEGDGQSGSGSDAGNDEFDRLRDYQPGDAPRTIAWKALASRGQLATKTFSAERGDDILLDLAAFSADDQEYALSVLASWIEHCEAERIPYALHVPGTQYATGLGEAQRRRCLDALALVPEKHP